MLSYICLRKFVHKKLFIRLEGKTIEETFLLKTKVYFNDESLKRLRGIRGSHAFIVSDTVMETLGYLKQVIDYLQEAGISSTVFTGVRPNPDAKVVADGLKLYMEASPDVLIAIGGGSAIDTAKGILYMAYQFGNREKMEFNKPLFLAIPSTSGTGSEVTDFSVITTEGEKVVVIDEVITPDIAILDPTCLQHVPQHVVADTGIDVLVHAIEAYVSNKANDFTDALAEKAIKLIFDNLVTLHQNPKDLNARERVQNASCLAGMAFTNAGLGINHSLAHAFGEAFHVSHGRSNAFFLNAVIEYNAELVGSANNYAAEKYAKIASILQLPARTKREGVVSLLLEVNHLKKSLGIENNIQAHGIDGTEFENALSKLAQTALGDRCTPTNPKQPLKEDLIKVLRKCY